jgi:hypothetical protein
VAWFDADPALMKPEGLMVIMNSRNLGLGGLRIRPALRVQVPRVNAADKVCSARRSEATATSFLAISTAYSSFGDLLPWSIVAV